jgi:hypothetical protein
MQYHGPGLTPGTTWVSSASHILRFMKKKPNQARIEEREEEGEINST